MKRNRMIGLIIVLLAGFALLIFKGGITGLFIGQPNEIEGNLDNKPGSFTPEPADIILNTNDSGNESGTQARLGDIEDNENDNNTGNGNFTPMEENKTNKIHPLEGQKINWNYGGSSSGGSSSSSSKGDGPAIPEYPLFMIPVFALLLSAGLQMKRRGF
ncbi:MAG: hypothetical protein DRN66_01200 [Candidatus Nanohalarchaeota archaeon]|nr:MAG: hypothetical protein DRN66_01200 [Candidatus Nanohaloarchaeota archaeon]